MSLEMEIREELDKHRFAGYGENQAWVRCACGEDYLEERAHQAEVIAEWSLRRVRQEMVASGWVSGVEKIEMAAALVKQIEGYRSALSDLRTRFVTMESSLNKARRDLDVIGRACRRAEGTRQDNGAWAEGVRAIELLIRTGFTGGIESVWKRPRKNASPGNKDQPWAKGDPWKHRGKG